MPSQTPYRIAMTAQEFEALLAQIPSKIDSSIIRTTLANADQTTIPTTKAVQDALDVISGDFSSLGNLAFTDDVDLSSTQVKGVTPIAKGGTGANSAAGARANLGILTQTEIETLIAEAVPTIQEVDLSSSQAVGVLPISKGGTGAQTATVARGNLGVLSSSETRSLLLTQSVILTDAGRAKINAATVSTPVIITRIGVSDALGTITSSRTSLQNEVWRGDVNPDSKEVSNKDEAKTFSGNVPTTATSFVVREVAYFDQDGLMIAIGQTQPTEKPSISLLSLKSFLVLDNVLQASKVVTKGVVGSLDDLQGFTDELYAQAGIVDDGLPDALGASQRVDAMRQMFPNIGTVADIASGKFKVGARISVTDRVGEIFVVKVGGTSNGKDVLPAAGVTTAELENKSKIDIRALGAVNGGVITSILQRAIDISNEVDINGDVDGDSYIVDDTVSLVKNDGGRLTFRINSTNAVIIPTTGAAKPWLKIDDTIKIELDGVTAVSANRDSYIDAVLWNSSIKNCFLETWVHSNNPVGFYRQSFFNEWKNSTMLSIDIHTGGGEDLAEFNNNTFTNINFLSTEPFLRIFGSQGVEGLRFDYCTAETQTGEMIYIDEQCRGDITFNGCYLDAANGGIPFDTKGLVVNFEGVCDVPVADFNAKTSLANTMARVLDTTVKQPYIGSFEPIGSVNYVKNGDLSENSSMVLGNFNTAVVSYDNAAINGKRCVINFDANDACFLDSSQIKSDGYYSVIVISRSSFNVNGYVDGVSGPILFGTLNVAGGLETQVATCTFYAAAGATPKITFVSTANGNNLLLDYACISHGKKAVLGPLKSVEKLSKLQEETGVVVANVGSIVKRFALSAFLRSSFTVDMYVEDFNAPDGVSYYKIAITTSETSASLTVVDSVVSGAPVTFSVSNQSGYFDLLANPNNGECTIRYKTLGYYRNV